MRIVIDLSDVLFYLRHHDTPSGIQRVQLGLAQTLIEGRERLAHDLIFVTSTRDGTRYVVISEAEILRIIARLAEPRVSHSALKQIIAHVEQKSSDYAPRAEDAFLLLGAFWVMENVFAQIAALKRAGVYIAILIHDIIPITHPEFCDKALTDSFNLFFNTVVPAADLVMTISEYTRGTVVEFFENLQISTPVVTLREAHRTGVPAVRNDGPRPSVASVALPARYVVYVSTIEVRKNHLYLFHIWKRLIAELGDAAPALVLVGRLGWRVRDLMEQLESTRFLDGRILILSGLSDVELASLYRDCLFTVFPSFVEGWGLPVGESLVFGRACAASGTTSVPEVGGRFVDYVDPYSVPDGYEKVRRLVVDDAYREERAALIKARFLERSWADVASDLIAILEEFVPQRIPHEVPAPLLEPGYHPFGHRRDMSWYVRSGFAANALRMCDGNWHGVEDFGRWMRGRHASVTFRVPYDPAERLRVVVEIETPPWFSPRVSITCNAVCRSGLTLKAGTRVSVEFRTASDDGAISLEFEVLGEIETSAGDARPLSIGIRSVSFAADQDVAARLHVLEWLEDMHVPG